MRTLRWPLLGLSLLTLASCSAKTFEGRENTAIPVHKYGATSGGGSLGLYTVRQGESVWTISQRYNLALRDILDANFLQPPYALKKGQRLSLPAPQTYKVRSKDSLYTISRLFNTSTTELVRINKLKPPYKVNEGQVLRLPSQYQFLSASASQPAVKIPAPQVEEKKDQPARGADRIEREELAPVGGQVAAKNPDAYSPPPSSPSDYTDDAPAVEDRPQAREVAAVAVPAKIPGKPPAREGKFIKPVSGKIISSYGLKQDGLHNDGINIQAAKGDTVRAAESGVVVYTGNQIAGYGNLILLRHADQYVTAYAHLEKTLVKKGDTVKRGQAIATVGATGAVDKPQLHFEIRKGTKALNPAGLVGL